MDASKRDCMSKSQIQTMLINFFDIKGQTVNQAYYVETVSSYVKLCVDEGLNFGPTIGFSTVTKLQLTRCRHEVFGTETDYWNGTVCLKGTKISRY
jgi:hypothetical protein